MKKVIFFEILATAVLAGLLFFFLNRENVKDIPLSLVEERVTSSCSLEGMEKVSDMRMKRSFGLNPADYEEILYYAPDNTMSVNEFFLVKVSDAGKSDVLAAIENRIAVQKTNFDGYGTDQMDLLKSAVIVNEGPYMGLFVGPEARTVYSICKEMWEE